MRIYVYWQIVMGEGKRSENSIFSWAISPPNECVDEARNNRTVRTSVAHALKISCNKSSSLNDKSQ